MKHTERDSGDHGGARRSDARSVVTTQVERSADASGPGRRRANKQRDSTDQNGDAASETPFPASRHDLTPDARLSSLLDFMADGVIFYDATGQPVQVNRGYHDLFGLDARPEVAALPLTDRIHLFAPRDKHGQPLSKEQWLPFRVLRGETLPDGAADEYMVRTLDGRELLIRGSGVPIRNAAGEIAGCVLLLRDVTEQRRQEYHTRDALDALLMMAETLVSERAEPSLSGAPGTATSGVSYRLAELTQTVLGSERVTIVPVGADGDVQPTVASAGPIEADESRQWEERYPQQGRRVLSDFLPPGVIARLQHGELVAVDRWQSPFNRWPNPGGWRSLLIVPMVLRHQLIGVVTLDFAMEAHTITDDARALAGGVARLAALVLDRERLLRAREEERAKALALQEANRRMDEFLGIATHELKTPVTSGSLTVQLAALRLNMLLSDPAADQDEYTRQLASLRELLTRAETSMDRLSRLVDDLLDVSRIRAGKLELRPERCDLADIVRESVAEQRQITPGRTIMLRLPGTGAVMVRADPDRTGQVLTNYLTNALKYSTADCSVRVRVSVRAGWARVAVRDEGPGLPRAEYRRIWDRFHRVPGIEVATGGEIGLGLGLHICKTIVEQQEGRVGVQRARGGGSIFWFSLPLAPAESVR